MTGQHQGGLCYSAFLQYGKSFSHQDYLREQDNSLQDSCSQIFL